MIYISMLAFQLSGALILLVKNINGRKNAIIKNCFPGSNIVSQDNEGRVTIPKEKIQESAHSIFLNIIAFADLTVGYGLAAFMPSSSMNKWFMFLITAIYTLTIMLIEWFSIKIYVRKGYSKDWNVQYSLLEQYGVESFATEEDINSILGIINN